MDFNQIVALFNATNITVFFFKAFAIVFSFMYFLYGIVIIQQTRELNNTVKESVSGIIGFISFIHIILGAVLLLLAIFFV